MPHHFQPDGATESAVTVVVPVYNAANDLANCVESVLACTSGDYRLILVDDASPDSAVAHYFTEFVARQPSHATLLRNETNLGFTATANRGMGAAHGDVVLLNSDTVVTQGWLEALVRCAASDPRIGTVTPFSNNAEICSFPVFCSDNPWPAGADAEPVRAALAGAAVPTYPDLPTAVGFCMYVRRTMIDAIGAFDMAFGQGYGEENDFCLRAARAGWRNVLCDDAFVVHHGSRSFSGQKAVLGPRNLAIIHERFPHYERMVHDYITADPLRALRDAGLARLRAYAGSSDGVLHVIDAGDATVADRAGALIEASRTRHRHFVAIRRPLDWQVVEHLAEGGTRDYVFARVDGESDDAFVAALCATFALQSIHRAAPGSDAVVAAGPSPPLLRTRVRDALGYCAWQPPTPVAAGLQPRVR